MSLWIDRNDPPARSCAPTTVHRTPGHWLGSMLGWAARCGFDGVSCIVVSEGTASPSLLRHWTSAGDDWIARYREHAYHRGDPRLTMTRGRTVPVVWDGALAAEDPDACDFRADAARRGIRGGAAASIVDARFGRMVLAWDCAKPMCDGAHRAHVRRSLGSLMLAAGFVSETMVAPSLAAGGGPLSPRERECLGLAANGMTSADIGAKLGIAERTVNFHFGRMFAKLGVLNRGEAIAKAIAQQLIPLAR
ncbi:MAG: LuxR C-terminal-related transcriptional regulator [Burkholderiales bacterium]